eukprot:g9862.t1
MHDEITDEMSSTDFVSLNSDVSLDSELQESPVASKSSGAALGTALLLLGGAALLTLLMGALPFGGRAPAAAVAAALPSAGLSAPTLQSYDGLKMVNLEAVAKPSGQEASPTIEGKWKLYQSDNNFDDFMQRLGVKKIVRILGTKSKPIVTITKNGGGYTFKQESLIKTTTFNFEIGKQFDETTADGRKVQSTMRLTSPTVLVHEMKGTGGKDSTCTRDFRDNEMICTCTVEEIVTVRKYKRT